MKTAFAIWNMRIAPVFDCAHSFLVLEQDAGVTRNKQYVTLSEKSALQFVLQNGIDRLVCGAISRENEQLLLGNRVEVISFVAGQLNEVIDAIGSGALVEQRFSMPGCGYPRRRCGRRRRGGGWRQFSDNF